MPQTPSLSDSQSIVELGARVAEAKAAESPAEFKVTREKMGLSQPVASKLAAIGEHKPVFCKFYGSLPNSYHSLYALKNLTESQIKGLIDSGALTTTTPVKRVEALVANKTLAPAVAERKRALSQMAELGTLRCSLSVNPKPFLKELEQLLAKYRLIEFVQDGGMGTRALTAEVMEGEGQEVESELIMALRHAPEMDIDLLAETDMRRFNALTKNLPNQPRVAALKCLQMYVSADEKMERRRRKLQAVAAIEGNGTLVDEIRERYPTIAEMLGLSA